MHNSTSFRTRPRRGPEPSDFQRHWVPAFAGTTTCRYVTNLRLTTLAGRDPFENWLDAMRDRHAAATILLRIGRLQRGLFGDCKSVGGGLWELRVDIGPGYRVYFGRTGENIILLLCGGDKRRQHDDIAQARRYWSTYKGATDTHKDAH